jgi:hypothetical protein
MIQLRSKRSRPYALNQKAELEARATLLARARTGDSHAQANLMRLYGVRVYSEAEREHTTVMGFLTRHAQQVARGRLSSR